MVNAIIADDNKDLCMTLANELNVTKEMKVLEMINDGTKVIQEIKRLKPEIIIYLHKEIHPAVQSTPCRGRIQDTFPVLPVLRKYSRSLSKSSLSFPCP